MKLTLVALATLAMIAPAAARDNGQWADQPAATRQWFQSLMQPDNPAVSCCGEADAFEADTFEVEGDHYIAIITDGKGMLPAGTRIPVPNSKMKWDAGIRPVPVAGLVGSFFLRARRHRLYRHGARGRGVCAELWLNRAGWAPLRSPSRSRRISF